MLQLIQKIPEGYSKGIYNAKKYSITKESFNDGRSYKIYGKELRGNDFISLNYYITKHNEHLKPCEMSEQKVIHFLEHIQIL